MFAWCMVTNMFWKQKENYLIEPRMLFLEHVSDVTHSDLKKSVNVSA